MLRILYLFLSGILLCSCILPPYGLRAQERTAFTLTAPEMKDTGRISDLIRKGVSLMNSHPDSAEGVLLEAATFSQASGYPYGQAKAFYHLGVLYTIKADYKKSIAYYQQSIPHTIRSGHIYDFLPFIYGNIGSAHIFTGEHLLAAPYLFQAAHILARDTSYPKTINIFNNLAALMLNLPRSYFPVAHERTLHYLELAEKNARRHNSLRNLSAIYGNKGTYYLQVQDYEKSLFYLDSALHIARSVGYETVVASSLITLGEVFLEQGRPTEALAPLREAAGMSGVPPYYESLCHFMLARACLATGSPEQARESMDHALALSEKHQLRYTQLLLYPVLAAYYASQHMYSEAYRVQEKYMELKDSLINGESAHTINHLDIRYRTTEKNNELIRNQLLLARQQARLRQNQLIILAVCACAAILSLLLYLLFRRNKQQAALRNNQIRLLRKEQQLLLRDQEIGQLRAMMDGEEKERGRLARELHDGVGGMLAAMKMHLGTLAREHPHLYLLKPVQGISAILDHTSDEIRRTAHNLIPDILLRFGLQKALETYCSHINESGKLTIHLQHYGFASTPDKATELMLYRIIQELVQNVIKHANATEAEIQLMEYEGKLSVTVEDNGAGFSLEDHAGGIGLQNMKFRVHSMGGSVNISTGRERHTTVHIEIPVKKE